MKNKLSVTRQNLLDLDQKGLVEYFADLGERAFRARQILQWVYQRGVWDFSKMTDLSQALRGFLQDNAHITLPEVVERRESKDGTIKWIVRVSNGDCVETVLIPERGRNTLCVSSQVGCVLDCKFCSTGKQGFNGNLATSDIIGQVLLANLDLAEHDSGKTNRRVTNVVLMGMGEPLLNFDAVIPATNLMLDDLAFGISKRRVTVSTAGVVPGIYALTKVTDVALAISLHAGNNALRDELVPINRKYPIEELIAACQHYLGVLGERRSITVEYTLMRDVNDSLTDAKEIAELLKDLRCKINLIPFNPFPGSGFDKPSRNRVYAFQTYLMQAGFATMLRTTRGDDINAACGQLVGQVNDRTKRQMRYRARIEATLLDADKAANLDADDAANDATEVA